jgi:hypothetical protein
MVPLLPSLDPFAESNFGVRGRFGIARSRGAPLVCAFLRYSEVIDGIGPIKKLSISLMHREIER